MSNWETREALEEAGIALHRIENLLQIYEEHIEEELQYLHKYEKNGVPGHFVARYDLLRSLLESIQAHTRDASNSVQQHLDTIREATSAEKDSAA